MKEPVDTHMKRKRIWFIVSLGWIGLAGCNGEVSLVNGSTIL